MQHLCPCWHSLCFTNTTHLFLSDWQFSIKILSDCSQRVCSLKCAYSILQLEKACVPDWTAFLWIKDITTSYKLCHSEMIHSKSPSYIRILPVWLRMQWRNKGLIPLSILEIPLKQLCQMIQLNIFNFEYCFDWLQVNTKVFANNFYRLAPASKGP